ncbi:hypothetical protein V8D89_005344 [Ganoderma adspersum]
MIGMTMVEVEPEDMESARVGMICSKMACDQCREPRTAALTLKQCGGCKVAWNCSKQCQVAALRSHKKICRSRSSSTVPPIYAPLGYATMAELLHQSGAWIEAHRFTLTIIANALVELGGGVDAALNTPQVVAFKLGPPRNYDGTPASAFTLEGMWFDHRDKFGGLTDPQWSPTMVTLRRLAARTFQEVNPDSILCGVLPVATFLRDAWEISPQTCFPLCRPRLAAGEVLDEETKGILENLMRMCRGAINAGIVLHMPEDPNKAEPEFGKVVPRGRAWISAPHVLSELGEEAAQDLTLELLRYCDPSLSANPIDCFPAYHRLWPYHSLRNAAKRVSEMFADGELEA